MGKLTEKQAAQVVGLILAVTTVAAIGWAFGWAKVPDSIPDYALQSAPILRAEMALAITIGAALPLLLIGRLFVGRFPDRLSPQGAEWRETAPEILEIVEDLKQNADQTDQVINRIIGILEEHQKHLIP